MRKLIESLKAGWIWLLLGAVAGIFIPADGMRSVLGRLPGLKPADGAEAEKESPDAHEGEYIALTDVARRNLGLRTGKVKAADYTRTIQIPGTVRERPALSDLAISSRVQGIVTHIYAVPGQAIRVGQPLFRISLTGDKLASSQAELLDAMQEIETIDRELKRLDNASRVGGLPAQKLQRLKYDRQKFVLRKENREQELMIRGLTEEQVMEIAKTKKFIQRVDVAMPAAVENYSPDSADQSFADGLNFTIEDLHVHPGKAIESGERLCDVAYHTDLYFEGQAFEKDVESIRAIAEDGLPVTVEFGTAGEHSHVSGLKVLYIDNHVHPDTQTFRFYLAVKNEVLGDVSEGDSVFRSWRFKPGQRGHVRVPLEELTGHFPLPREAVLIEGPEAFVFREVKEDAHAHTPGDGHNHDAHMKEFEPVPVHVMFQDGTTVVVAAGKSLSVGDKIAMNHAYDLQLAMKSGGGTSHDHHGHQH